jgi:hypothetical protein
MSFRTMNITNFTRSLSGWRQTTRRGRKAAVRRRAVPQVESLEQMCLLTPTIVPILTTAIVDAGGGPVTNLVGESVMDTAAVTPPAPGDPTPTGDYEYKLYNTANPFPSGGPPATPIQDTTGMLNSNGTVPNSPVTAPLAAGPYTFLFRYFSGNYVGGTVLEHLSIGNPVQSGDFATIGFWHNNNGQALIDQLNGGGSTGTATNLGTWLATNFPHLYGADVDPSNPYEQNLNGATNAVVASFYLNSLFDAHGLYKTYAQVMAVALASYATSSTLAGGTYAQPYGFNVSAGGTGTDIYNVGSDGSALGLPNNSNQSVLDILAAADALAASTTNFNSKLSNINDIFSGINQTGDIS